MLPTSLLHLISYTLGWLNYGPSLASEQADASVLGFELRHIHAVSPEARVVWADVSRTDHFAPQTPYYVHARSISSSRPASHDAFLRARTLSRVHRQSAALSWEEDQTSGPDVERRDTLLALAKMTNNAYLMPDEQGWYPLGDHWNVVSGPLCRTTHAYPPLRGSAALLRYN